MAQLVKKLVFISALVSTFVSNAALITVEDYTLNTDSNSVISHDTNLEWLRWDQTIGMSIYSALDQYESSGWRIANQHEMIGLINDVFSSQLTYSPLYMGIGEGWDYDYGDNEANSFFTLFGITDTHCYEEKWQASCVDDPLRAANAWFYEEFDNGYLNPTRAKLLDAYTYQARPGLGILENGQRVGLRSWAGEGAYWSYDTVGVALVRNTNDVVDVPEPSIFFLTLAGFGALLMRRKV